MAYTVTFWGTRGSIPTPGAHTARYGGNTPCVAVEGSGGGKGGRGGQLVILDAGTGIRALGRELVERQNGAVQAEILLSHAHWTTFKGCPTSSRSSPPATPCASGAHARGRRRSRRFAASSWPRRCFR